MEGDAMETMDGEDKENDNDDTLDVFGDVKNLEVESFFMNAADGEARDCSYHGSSSLDAREFRRL
jgi:hypothetical protein